MVREELWCSQAVGATVDGGLSDSGRYHTAYTWARPAGTAAHAFPSLAFVFSLTTFQSAALPPLMSGRIKPADQFGVGQLGGPRGLRLRVATAAA